MLSNLHKLVNGAHATEYRKIPQYYVAGHLGIVAHDAVVTNLAIMGDVTICHDKAVVPNLGCPPVFTSAVNGYKFTNGSVVANFDGSWFILKFKVLRNRSYNCPRKDPAVFADAGAFHDGYIASDPGAFTNFYVLVYDTKGINFYIRSKLGIRMDVCMGVNHWWYLLMWN
jgi:hypothetical protein